MVKEMPGSWKFYMLIFLGWVFKKHNEFESLYPGEKQNEVIVLNNSFFSLQNSQYLAKAVHWQPIKFVENEVEYT